MKETLGFSGSLRFVFWDFGTVCLGGWPLFSTAKGTEDSTLKNFFVSQAGPVGDGGTVFIPTTVSTLGEGFGGVKWASC